MKMTYERMTEINRAMGALDEHTRSFKISYALAKNLGKLRPEIDALQKASEESKEHVEYREKQRFASASVAVKDEDDAPRVAYGQFVITDPVALERVSAPLRDKYAEVIAEREKQDSDLKIKMKEEIELDLHTISAELIEEDKAFSDGAVGLAKMIEPLLGLIIVDAPVDPAKD